MHGWNGLSASPGYARDTRIPDTLKLLSSVKRNEPCGPSTFRDKLIISARRSREIRGTTRSGTRRGPRTAALDFEIPAIPVPPSVYAARPHCRPSGILGVPLVDDKAAVSMGFRVAFRWTRRNKVIATKGKEFDGYSALHERGTEIHERERCENRAVKSHRVISVRRESFLLEDAHFGTS